MAKYAPNFKVFCLEYVNDLVFLVSRIPQVRVYLLYLPVVGNMCVPNFVEALGGRTVAVEESHSNSRSFNSTFWLIV